MYSHFPLNGVNYPLDHMNVMKSYTTALLGNVHKRVAVEITYSCHCWSRLPVEGESIPPNRFVADGSVQNPRNRIFCEERHELSRSLPSAMEKMLLHSGHVSKTDQENILRIDEAIPVVANGSTVKYYIFMTMEKRMPEGKQKYIRIFVETAYPENVLYKKMGDGKPYSFAKLAGETWKGEYESRSGK